jgi:predicted RNase H-like HicB family nuclease
MSIDTATQAIDTYLAHARRYAVTVVADEAPDAPFVARAAEFPYTCGAGDTPEEAVAVLTEMLADTIEVLENEGRPGA